MPRSRHASSARSHWRCCRASDLGRGVHTAEISQFDPPRAKY